MFKIESILSHYLKLVNVSFRSASKQRKVVLDFSTPPAPNETPFDQPIPPKSANNVPSPTKREKDSFYAGLQRACPTAVALSLHAEHSDSFVPKCVSGTAPRPLDQLYDSSVPCDIYNDVLLHCATNMLRSNHLVQTVRTTFPVVQTVPFTFPLGISHLHLWRSGDGFSDSVCTAGKKMASLHIKPYIIALQLQLCTWREPSYSRIRPLPMRWSGGGGGC